MGHLSPSWGGRRLSYTPSPPADPACPPPALGGRCEDCGGGLSVPSPTWDPRSPPWGRFSVPCPIPGQFSAAFIPPLCRAPCPTLGCPSLSGDVLNPAPGGVSCPLPGESVGTLL